MTEEQDRHEDLRDWYAEDDNQDIEALHDLPDDDYGKRTTDRVRHRRRCLSRDGSIAGSDSVRAQRLS